MLAIIAAVIMTQLSIVHEALNGWWLIGGDSANAFFAHRGSISGPMDARRVDLIRVLPRTVGIRAQSLTYEFDCHRRISTTLRLEGLSNEGSNLGPLPVERSKNNMIQPGTFGEYALQFACFEASKESPEVGYATMLPPITTADHFFRLLGIGLDREIAAGLAGYDAEKAPKTFEKVLNALVETNLHLYVRAIKTPDATVD